MIVSNIYRYSPENAQKNVSTKKIRLDDTGSLFFQIEASSDSFIHLIESELVDLTINGKKGSETDEIYFSKILEALNRFLYQKEKTFGNTQIRMFIGLFRIDRVTFSVCGKYQVYFSQGSTITDIADGMGGRDLEFSYVSHGILTPRDSLYISNTTLLEFLTPEDLLEFSEDPEPTVVESLLAREIENERIDCLVFAPEGRTSLLESLTHTDHTGSSFLTSLVKTGQSLGTKSLDIFQRLRLRDRWITLQKSPWYITMTGDRRFRMGILVLGIGVALVFLYLIANSLFQASLGTAVPEEYKSKLIEAEQILARSTRDL